MDILLRETLTAADQGTEFQDRELSASVITLGSRQDQTIQLLGEAVGGRHAELRASGGVLQIKALRGYELIQNGEPCSSVSLSPGEQVQIGGNTLEAMPAPGGFDGGVILTPDPDVDRATFENAYQTSLDETWLSKRGPAWITLALVLIFGLGVPLYLVMDGDDSTPAAGNTLLTDAIWTSGPLHAVHNQSIGDDCSACHTELFERVPDEACVACHTEISDHIVPGHAALEAMPIERCAVCHKEHNDPTLLVIEADSLCTDCHADTETLNRVSPHLEGATGFAKETHPAFEVALPVALTTQGSAGLEFDWGIEETPLDGAKEVSNLKFPHDLHIDKESMACADCHTLSTDREHFVPVNMEAHCRDCHELTFDGAAPERQLPHGLPREAVATMEGHFIRVYANPTKAVTPPKRSERRRRPNRAAAPTNACSGSAVQCALDRTRTEVINQFTRSGCVTCHQVDDTQSSDIYARFQVYPVRLSGDFMPTARFDHHSHLTQKDKEGDQACLTCHGATASSESTDLMIPDIGNCTSCHSDHTVADSVPLDCVDCHAFHPQAPATLFRERTP